MDINKVKFGSYAIGASTTGAKKQEAKAEQNAIVDNSKKGLKQLSADETLSAMNATALYNKANVLHTNNATDKYIERLVAKYSNNETNERIAAMMGNFENGVKKAADAIDAEFPGLFADDTKLALAAQVFAKEQ